MDESICFQNIWHIANIGVHIVLPHMLVHDWTNTHGRNIAGQVKIVFSIGYTKCISRERSTKGKDWLYPKMIRITITFLSTFLALKGRHENSRRHSRHAWGTPQEKYIANKNPLCLTVRRLRNQEALFSCLCPWLWSLRYGQWELMIRF